MRRDLRVPPVWHETRTAKRWWLVGWFGVSVVASFSGYTALSVFAFIVFAWNLFDD